MVRGKIMRDTNVGPGIVLVNGEQKVFSLESHWKSSTPPKVGAVVEVELDSQGSTLAVTIIDEAERAKEHAQKALDFAAKNGKLYGGILLERVGALTLICTALMVIAWLFLATLTVQISGDYSESASFYNVLKMLNAGCSLESVGSLKYAGAGLYGFLMWIAILAPIATHFNSNKYLQLAYCVPLLYWVSICLTFYFSIKSRVAAAQGMANDIMGSAASEMASQMMSMTLRAISMGLGFYVAAIVTIYLAVTGIKKYLTPSITV
jgi:hypothetical protein